MRIDVYICPTPGCGNYYGSSSMPDLSAALNASEQSKARGTRDECPDCKARGRVVRRRRCTMQAEVSGVAA